MTDLRLEIHSTKELIVLRPYFMVYSTARKFELLAHGRGVRVPVPNAQAALELWSYVFTYGEPQQLAVLREILIAEGVEVPELVLTSQTHIKWLECDPRPGYLNRVLFADIRTIGQLIGMTEKRLSFVRGVGQPRIDRIKERLAFYSLSLRDEE